MEPRDWRFAALSVAGAANAVVYDWTRQSSSAPVEEVERLLVGLAVRILAGPVEQL